MKRSLPALLCLAAVGWISPALQSTPAFAHEDGSTTQPSKQHGEVKRDPIMVALEKLDLSESQRTKINSYIQDTKEKIRQIYLKKRDGDKEEMWKAVSELRKNLIHQIAGELTEDQRRRFLSLLEEFRDDHEQKGKDAAKGQHDGDASTAPGGKGDSGAKGGDDGKGGDGWEPAK